jgi:hypothetical protein
MACPYLGRAASIGLRPPGRVSCSPGYPGHSSPRGSRIGRAGINAKTPQRNIGRRNSLREACEAHAPALALMAEVALDCGQPIQIIPVTELDFGQKFNGLAIVRGAK